MELVAGEGAGISGAARERFRRGKRSGGVEPNGDVVDESLVRAVLEAAFRSLFEP